MKKLFLAVVLLLFTGILAGGCVSQNAGFTLAVIPPQNLQPPLQGTWEIVSLLQEGAAAQGEKPKWVGKTISFADKYVLLGDYLLLDPLYQVKKVAAETFLFYRHQVFPPDFHFQDPEIEVLTLYDKQLFCCELLQEKDGNLLLILFDNSYLVQKISDKVGEAVFPSLEIKNAGTEMDTGSLKETVNNHTGVLLGLRTPCQDLQGKSGENYRTLWLVLADEKLAPVLETKTILFPRRSGFYQLQVVRKEKEEKGEDFLIVDHILKQEEEEKKESAPVLPWDSRGSFLGREEGGGCVMRKICYVGNDYVSIEETFTQSPVQGSNVSEESKLHIYAIDSLPGTKAVKISDLAGQDALKAMEHGRQKLLQQLGLEQEGPADERNFGLARKMGHWIFNGRESYLKKNEFEKTDYDITVIPPNNVVSYNKLHIPWTRVKNRVPGAIDIFTSPAKNLALVVTNNEIIVYEMHQGNLLDPPLGKIPLNKDEDVIMAEWALGQYVEDWTLTFKAFSGQE